MRKKLKYFLTLVWFVYLIVTSILLFTRGFLLTREVQHQNSSCSSLNEIYCGSDEHTCVITSIKPLEYEKAAELCWKSNQRVIVLIVDALRYDFALFDDDNKKPLPYENKLPIFKTLLAKEPKSSRLYKFIADPPTTTMQRLKALTTGSLPTFIDAGSNFATSEINEDNIIDQLIKNEGKIVFMGDDTWTLLYPNRFIRNYPYPSFDVWDLDTVDNGNREHLFSELNKTDWNLLIGHFLGVDHCGHRYGPDHPEMSRKLTEINAVIQATIEAMDVNSVLFVLGDHGMTMTGDHGGESLDEIQAALFVYSRNPLLSLGKAKNIVKQIDLVPTISAILGIPIPFQNLGSLIHSALPIGYSNSWQLPLFSLWGNVQQVINYIKAYSEQNDIFDKEYLQLYYREFEEMQTEVIDIKNQDEFLAFASKAEEFLLKVRTLCEEVWIQFDAFSISNGLTFLFLTIFFMFIISDGIPLKQLPLAIEGSFVDVCILSLIVTSIAVSALDFSNIIENFSNSLSFIINVLSHLMFLLPIFQNWDVISFNWYYKNKSYGIINLICRFVLIFNICVVFSNSFINEESSVLLFLLVTVIVLIVLGLGSFLKSQDNKSKNCSFITFKSFWQISLVTLVVLCLLRSSVYFWRCRVEQEWCFKTPHSAATKSPSTKVQWGLSVLSLCVMISLTRIWLKKCGNINGYSITEVCAKLIPNVMIVCTAGFWVLQRLAGNNASVSKTSQYLALSVYALAATSITILGVRPVCVSLVLHDQSLGSVADIFKRLRGGFENEVPIVCGLATVYSAVYVMLGTFVALVIALVLGDFFAVSAVLMITVGAVFLLLSSVYRIKRAESIDDLLNVPTEVILGWSLLPQYFFYASGHQPAFPNIAWESAFVGTSTITSNNYILGSLIIVNTFGSHILAGLLVPLLVITPFTLFIMMPSVYGKRKEFSDSGPRGELLLFEQEKRAVAGLFAVSCRYIAAHALKVFASMLAATIHCRHLMVWNVFAPKFIFEAVGLFVTLAAVLIGFLLFLRVNSQVGRLIQKLTKIN